MGPVRHIQYRRQIDELMQKPRPASGLHDAALDPTPQNWQICLCILQEIWRLIHGASDFPGKDLQGQKANAHVQRAVVITSAGGT